MKTPLARNLSRCFFLFLVEKCYPVSSVAIVAVLRLIEAILPRDCSFCTLNKVLLHKLAQANLCAACHKEPSRSNGEV